MEEIIKTYLSITPSYKQFYINNNSMIQDENISPETLFNNVQLDADIVLQNLNISPSKCGYAYWIDAVFIYLLSGKNRLSICNCIYPVIAKKHNTSAVAVERAMRLCFVDLTFPTSKYNENFICGYFKNSLMYPHNNDILVKLVDFVSSKNFQQNKHKVQL